MNMNEPKLRFKADDGSQFPDWEEKKLGDITEKVVRKDANSNADVRMISQGNGFILQSNKYSRENAGQSLKKYTLLKRDEFAYNHGASKVKPYGVCYRLCESDEARVPYVYHTFKLIDGDSVFWNYSLNTSCMDRQLKKMVSSGARMDGLLNIGYDAYMSVNIHVPSLPEQQKIAEFLSTIDTVIEKQKETVSAWEKRKKGVMQKLFSQEVRFKADDGSDFPEWEEKKLGDICKTFSGGTPKSGEARYYENGTISFIRSGEIHDDKTELRITNDGLNESSAKMVDVGDILYALYGATSGEVDISKIKGAINQAILCIRPLNDFNRKFIVEILRHNKETILRTYLQGGQGNLSAQIIQSLVFDFPCLAEQQKIADCLSSLDEVIEKQKATLAAWEEMKKGLLQQMFV